MNRPAHTPCAPRPDNTMTYDGFILSVKQTASRLGVTTRTVRNYLVQKRNPLPHSKPAGKVLIHTLDLDLWLKKKK